MWTRQLLILALFAMATVNAAAAEPCASLTSAQEDALRAMARDKPFEWAEMSEDQARCLFQKAKAYFDIYQQYHLRHGLNADVWYRDYDRKEIYRLEGIGDSACWMGHYLAALALQYHLEPSETLRADMIRALESFDMLTKISGRTGYVARYAGPASSPEYREYYKVYGRGESQDRPGLGKCAYWGVEPYSDQVWLGNSSRDTYDGVNFGLAVTMAYVKDHDVLERVKQLVERIGDRLIEDSWTILDGQGNRTRGLGSFKMTWIRTMLSANPKKYARIEDEYHSLCSKNCAKRTEVYDIRYKEYFANNLTYIRMFSTAILENDPERKKMICDALKRMQDRTASHLNAHFAAMYAVASGDKADPKVRAAVQGLLIDFPEPPKFQHEVDLRNDASHEPFNQDYTKYAQLPRERVPTDFMWQRSPCVSHGSATVSFEFPGIDAFLPYWMGRAAGIVPAPTGTNR